MNRRLQFELEGLSGQRQARALARAQPALRFITRAQRRYRTISWMARGRGFENFRVNQEETERHNLRMRRLRENGFQNGHRVPVQARYRSHYERTMEGP